MGNVGFLGGDVKFGLGLGRRWRGGGQGEDRGFYLGVGFQWFLDLYVELY